MKKNFRQGELRFEPIEEAEFPRFAKKLETNIIREGELTGHKHELEGGEIYNSDGTLFVRTEKGAVITHPEHKPLTLPPGDHKIHIQREYDEKHEREVND